MASTFWIITNDDGTVSLINGDLIRFVDELRPDHMLIHFDDKHVLELEGRSASEAIGFFDNQSRLMNGQPTDLRKTISAKPK